jgi:hypothetical protein
MGTPVACAYATLTYGHFENTTILPKFSQNLLYYRRYIDDIFGIWIPTPGSDITWRNFKEQLNNWGTLKWVVEKPSKQTHFLDLNIQIKDSSIRFSTYQKPLNLYLYIPPSSAHPTSCLKGLIRGELQRYWLQNQPKDFEDLVTRFIERLHARGHSVKTLKNIFLQAALSLDTPRHTLQKCKNHTENDNALFIHWTYHPGDLQRQTICCLFDSTLTQHTYHDKMVVAISRPKNLRDILSKTALKVPDRIQLQDLISQIKQNTNNASP